MRTFPRNFLAGRANIHVADVPLEKYLADMVSPLPDDKFLGNFPTGRGSTGPFPNGTFLRNVPFLSLIHI